MKYDVEILAPPALGKAGTVPSLRRCPMKMEPNLLRAGPEPAPGRENKTERLIIPKAESDSLHRMRDHSGTEPEAGRP